MFVCVHVCIALCVSAATHGDVLALGKELAAEGVDNPFNHNDTAVDATVRRLCSRDKNQTVVTDRHLLCLMTMIRVR